MAKPIKVGPAKPPKPPTRNKDYLPARLAEFFRFICANLNSDDTFDWDDTETAKSFGKDRSSISRWKADLAKRGYVTKLPLRRNPLTGKFEIVPVRPNLIAKTHRFPMPGTIREADTGGSLCANMHRDNIVGKHSG